MTKKKKKKVNILPASAGLTILLIAILLLEVAMIFLLGVLNILPVTYFLGLLAFLVVIDALLLVLFRIPGKSKKKIVGIVIAALAVAVLVLGTYYLFNTYKTLYKISGGATQWEEYDVIVIKDSKYNEIDDINGETVICAGTQTSMFEEAQGKLQAKESVEYKQEKDIVTAGSKLIDENGKTNDEILFTSKSSYGMINEELKDFKSGTKVLYKVMVPLKTGDNASKKDVTKDPFNIYISGIDVWGEIDQVSRSDVNMIVTVNPRTHEILLTSMPRDSYVKLHTYQEMDKLTHTGVFGIDETLNTVEDWLDVDIDYYVRADFSMLVHLVDAVGGVDVNSDYAFKSKISKYTYKKGMNHLNGKQALYFARERKAFEDEDEQRVRNQQKVVKALLKKVLKSKTLLTKYTEILDAVEGEMEMSLTQKEVSALVRMQLDDMKGWHFQTISVNGDDAMMGTYSMGMGRELFVSIPREKSVERVKTKIQSIMYPDTGF